MPRKKLPILAGLEEGATRSVSQSMNAGDGPRIVPPGLRVRRRKGGVYAEWRYISPVDGARKSAQLGLVMAADQGPADKAVHAALRDAIEEAREQAGQVRAGIDPKADNRQENQLDRLLDEWLEKDQTKNRKHAEIRRFIDKEVRPVWGNRLAQDIRRRDVENLLDAIKDRGSPGMARRSYTVLARLFGWLVGREILAKSPMENMQKKDVVGSDQVRVRKLNDADDENDPETKHKKFPGTIDEEMCRMWWAAKRLGYPFGHVFRLLLLTGCRASEISQLRWEEIDTHEKVIRLPASRTKNGRAHTVPMSPLAWNIIENLPGKKDSRGRPSPYVFTTTGDKPVARWMSSARKRLDSEAATIGPGGRPLDNPRPLPEWRPHDLRRTCAVGLQRLKFRHEVIEAVLNHVSGAKAGVAGVYQSSTMPGERREALNAWAVHIFEVTTGAALRPHIQDKSIWPTADVVPFHKTA